MTEVQFFGRLREIAEQSGERFHLDASIATIELLLAHISDLSPALGEALRHPSVRCIVDGAIIDDQSIDIRNAAEIAFIPPVSGG